MANIKAVLFDLDGTLINTLEDLATATNYALKQFGYPEQEIEKFKIYAGNGVAVMLERAMPQSEVTPERIKELKTHFLTYYEKHFDDKTRAYDGVSELLSELRKRGYLLAVVTNKVDEMARLILNKLYPGSFDLIYGQRDSVPSKPDPTLAFMAMDKLGVTPEQCVFVGDSGVDIATAVNSKALPVGVLWGFRNREELLENGARHIIGRPMELLPILENLE